MAQPTVLGSPHGPVRKSRVPLRGARAAVVGLNVPDAGLVRRCRGDSQGGVRPRAGGRSRRGHAQLQWYDGWYLP